MDQIPRMNLQLSEKNSLLCFETKQEYSVAILFFFFIFFHYCNLNLFFFFFQKIFQGKHIIKDKRKDMALQAKHELQLGESNISNVLRILPRNK